MDTNTISVPGARHILLRQVPTALSVLLIVFIAIPIMSVVILALGPAEGLWQGLLATVLPRYLLNTLILTISVGLVAATLGTVTAWLVTMCEFPGRRIFEWALFLPLAVPAYIGAYALVDFFEYAGPLQTAMRATFGYSTAQDYVFPEIRSMGGAVLVLSAALYPYVYLLVRIAFREQSVLPQDVARTLGAGPMRRFFRVGLSMTRPSIAIGTAIVMMETISEFGTVEYFAVQTLTTGIFSVWLDGRNIAGASQLALVALVLMGFLVGIERLGRRRMRFTRMVGSPAMSGRLRLQGVSSLGACIFCLLPVGVGFLLPVGVVVGHSLGGWHLWFDDELAQSLANTLLIGIVASFMAIGMAIVLSYAAQLSAAPLLGVVMPLSVLGYALPGAVLGLGLLLPLAAVDHAIADSFEYLTGYDIGLILTGSAAAIVLAHLVRFFAVAHGAAETAMNRVPPSLRCAARSLGSSPQAALMRVYLPIMRGSLFTGFVLVFVDCVKELPATLLLRPFDFNTLATRVYERASLENLSGAAPAALLVTLVGAFGAVLLARINR